MSTNDTIDSAIQGIISSLTKGDAKKKKIVCPNCHHYGDIEDYEQVPTLGISGFITLRCKQCDIEFLPDLNDRPKTKDIDIDALERARQRRKRDGA